MSATTWERALVTGASAGIGAALCRALAAEGTDLVVVARDAVRLETLAADLGAAYGVKVEVLAADLCERYGLDEVADRVGSASDPLDLVVNNAGFAVAGDFLEVAADDIQAQIDLNVSALTRLTRVAADTMRDRGRGAVLNVSSVAGLAPGPGTATYSATKAFVTNLGLSVAAELHGTGVTITTLHPGFTRTEFQVRSGYLAEHIPGFLWQSADEVVAEALKATRAGRPFVVSGTPNRLAAGLLGFVPRGVQSRAVRAMSRFVG